MWQMPSGWTGPQKHTKISHSLHKPYSSACSTLSQWDKSSSTPDKCTFLDITTGNLTVIILNPSTLIFTICHKTLNPILYFTKISPTTPTSFMLTSKPTPQAPSSTPSSMNLTMSTDPLYPQTKSCMSSRSTKLKLSSTTNGTEPSADSLSMAKLKCVLQVALTVTVHNV